MAQQPLRCQVLPLPPSRMLVRTSHSHFAVSSVCRSFCVSGSCTLLVLLAGGPPWAAVLMCGVQERECGGLFEPACFFCLATWQLPYRGVCRVVGCLAVHGNQCAGTALV